MQKKTVFVIDDEDDLTWSISRYLNKSNGYLNVKSYNAAEEALPILLNRPADLIITDIRMPKLSGTELLQKVQARWPETKAIVMTAFGSQDIEYELSTLNNVIYIEKPFELRELRKLAFELLEPDEPDIEALYAQSRIREMVVTNCISHRTTMMLVDNGFDYGRIYMKQGEIVHAECGELEGENALMNILDWERCQYHATPHFTCEKKTISKDWKSLLNPTMIE